jgi:meso-butanediol dehydrogenase / (S,S)-butanediol dehydrogenase / diacetyl reductase
LNHTPGEKRALKRLADKIAIVTGGAGSGIGHGISLELARAGALVVIVELDLAASASVRKQIENEGGKAFVLKGDVSVAAEVRSVMEQMIEEHKRIDILVNNAGIGLIRPVADATEQEFDHLMSIDLRGLWLCCKHVIPRMRQQRSGVIINIGSVHGKATKPLFGLYAAMKAGVAGLTRGIAVQYGVDGIRANTINPGLVDGRQTRAVIARIAPDIESWLSNFVSQQQAMPYLIQPEDIGRVAAFLASEDARAITGAEIPVDAGTLALLGSRE